MRCPFCGHLDTTVKDSRPADDMVSIRRRRFCSSCSSRFTTIERVQLRELTVLKKEGRSEPFDREKIMRALRLALHKRPIEEERIERVVSSIVRQLEVSGEVDIPSSVIGEMVMDVLSHLDSVGYVRFASIYKDFHEAEDFEKFIEKIDRQALTYDKGVLLESAELDKSVLPIKSLPTGGAKS